MIGYIRLGLQGVELLSTGPITLPTPEPSRTWLRGLRVGKVDKLTVIDTFADLRAQLVRSSKRLAFPSGPIVPG